MTQVQKTVLLIVLTLVLVIFNADGNVMAPLLDMIRGEFGVNDGDIGLITGLMTVLGAVVSLFWGYFADKASRKILFAGSVLLGALPCMLTAIAPNYTVFFILRILTGIGLGAAFPLVFSIVGDVYNQKERPIANAILTTTFGLGQILGGAIGGYAGAVTNSWRLPFVFVSAPVVILIAIFWFMVPEPKKGASEEATRELVAQGVLYPKTIRISDYANLTKIKTNVLLFIQGIFGTIPWGAFFFLQEYLMRIKNLTRADATTVYLIFGSGFVVGTLFGGWAGGKLFNMGRKLLPLFCSITTAFGAVLVLILFTAIPSNIILLSTFGFLGALFSSMTAANIRTMILDTNTPEDRGAIFSIFNLTDSLGTGIGKYFAGMVSVGIGLAGALTISSSFWFFCAVLLWISASVFPKDIDNLNQKMINVAKEMKTAQ